MEIFKLFGSILIDSKEAEDSLSKIDDKAEKTGNKFVEIAGGAAKFGLAIGAAAVGGAAALFGIAESAAGAAAEIDDMAGRTGLSTQTLQEYKYAAEQSGFSLDTIEASTKKLTVTMGNAANGNKTAQDAFAKLGLSAVGANGKLKSTDEMFPQIIKKLADMGDTTERNALMVQIFGKSAMDMAPMLNDGAAGVDALTNKAHDLGLVMSEEAIASSAQFDDSLATLKSSFGAVIQKIGIELLPVFQQMMDWVMAHMPEIQEFTRNAFNIISTVVNDVGWVLVNILFPAFSAIYDFIITYVVPVMSTLWDGVNGVVQIFKDVAKAIETAYNWLKTWNGEPAESKTSTVTISEYTKQLTGKAAGTNYWTGGPVLIGEEGPEILNLPRGSEIVPNSRVGSYKNQASTAKNQNIYIDKMYVQDKGDEANNLAQLQFMAAI